MWMDSIYVFLLFFFFCFHFSCLFIIENLFLRCHTILWQTFGLIWFNILTNVAFVPLFPVIHCTVHTLYYHFYLWHKYNMSTSNLIDWQMPRWSNKETFPAIWISDVHWTIEFCKRWFSTKSITNSNESTLPNSTYTTACILFCWKFKWIHFQADSFLRYIFCKFVNSWRS